LISALQAENKTGSRAYAAGAEFENKGINGNSTKKAAGGLTSGKDGDTMAGVKRPRRLIIHEQYRFISRGWRAFRQHVPIRPHRCRT
jgi:hypothetical protein